MDFYRHIIDTFLLIPYEFKMLGFVRSSAYFNTNKQYETHKNHCPFFLINNSVFMVFLVKILRANCENYYYWLLKSDVSPIF